MPKIIYLFILLLAFASCKKEPIPELPEGNEPFYTLKGNIGGDIVNLVVGDGETEIRHGNGNMNGVNTFFGELKAPGENLVFRIEMTEPELLDFKEEVLEQNIAYLDHKKGCLVARFGVNGSQQQKHLYIEKDNETLVRDTSVSFNEFGQYEVGFQFYDYGQEIFRIPVSYGFDRVSLNSKFNISGESNNAMVYAESDKGTHKWYIDEELVSEETFFSHNIGNGIHKITHEIQEDNSTSSYTTLVRFRSGEFYWQMKLNYCDLEISKQNFGKVKLSVQKDNVWYYSDNGNPSENESFALSNINYILGENLETEQAIFDFKLKSKLWTKDLSESIDLEDVSGSFKIGF